MHLCTEKNRSRIRSHRSLPSKIHAATPPQNCAAVESLLSAVRPCRVISRAAHWSSRSGPAPLAHSVFDTEIFTYAGPLCARGPLLGGRFLWHLLVCRVSSSRCCSGKSHGKAAIMRRQPARASFLRVSASSPLSVRLNLTSLALCHLASSSTARENGRLARRLLQLNSGVEA